MRSNAIQKRGDTRPGLIKHIAYEDQTHTGEKQFYIPEGGAYSIRVVNYDTTELTHALRKENLYRFV